MRLQELKRQVGRADYVVDPGAVADAILRRNAALHLLLANPRSTLRPSSRLVSPPRGPYGRRPAY